MIPVLVTAPTAQIVTLAEAKEHLRVEQDAEDALISGYIDAATGHLDGWNGILGRALALQTWEVSFDRFPAEIILPFGPVESVVSVTYKDADGVTQTVDAADYDVSKPRRLVAPVPGTSWPTATGRDCVTVQWVAGGDIPKQAKQAALLLIGGWYEVRESISEAKMSEVPFGVISLLSPLRRGIV